MRRGIAALFAITLGAACGGAREPPAPARAPAPSAPAPAPGPLTDAGSAEDADAALPEAATPKSTPPELSKEQAELAESLLRSRFVVRGRVREAKEKVEQQKGVAVRYQYAIVDVLEWVEGDPKHVLPGYVKSFPIWNTPVPVMVSKSPGIGHRDPPLELVGRAGDELLFLVSLPEKDREAWGEPGPPGFILQRWGKWSVSVMDHLPLEARAEIAATRETLAKRREWIQANAKSLRVRDRFTADGAEAVAKAVASFVVAELRTRAKLKVEPGAPERKEAGAIVYRFPLTGDPDATGTLSVSVSASSGRVSRFQLDVPLAKQGGSGAFANAAAAVAGAKSSLGIRSEGGELFGNASQSVRGDGVTFWRVVYHPGHLHGSVPSTKKSVVVLITPSSGVVFDYQNAWASDSASADDH